MRPKAGYANALHCIPCGEIRAKLRQRNSKTGQQRRPSIEGHAPRRDGEVAMLPVGPFSDWLRSRIAYLQRIEQQSTWQDLVGLSGRSIRAIVHCEYPTVNLDLVDRVLTRDDTTNLQDLYPDLYPDEEAQAA